MNSLQLSFLGRFSAQVGERSLKITSPKQQALLLWLALNGERSHDRGELTALLWPEHDGQRARQNMRQVIAVLRRQIGGYLDVTRKTIGLRAECWHSDVGRFEQRLEAGDHEAAVQLYAGDLLPQLSIESPEFEEWLLLKREWLRRRWLQSLAQLTAASFASQQYDAAYRYAWQRTEADVYDERAHADVMQALALQGRNSEALAQYEQLGELLQAELGVEPALETQQLADQILKRQFSQPASRYSPAGRHNLPRQHTPFVGRRELLERLDDLLAKPSCGLLTLVGMGGSGKTRLAIELGRQQQNRFRDGVWFVALAGVDAAAGEQAIVQAITQALDLNVPHHVAEPRAYLLNHLARRQALLLLDNYENLSDEVDLLLDLLAAAPDVKIVVTSREALDLEAEWVVDLPGLPFPPADWQGPLDRLLAFEAVELFATSAGRRRADFELTIDAARIARLTHGLPLGLTLAAGWTRTLSIKQVADQIAADVDFLATKRRDVDERHRSLRAIFEQTWRMLDRDEQQTFVRLAVFQGGFTPAAAAAVSGAAPALLERLLDRSLLLRSGDDRLIIHPLLGQYAAEHLPPDDLLLRRRHAGYYLEQLAAQGNELPVYYDHPAIGRLRVEIENIKVAWSTAVRLRDAELLSRAIVPATTFLRTAGLWQLLDSWLDALDAGFSASRGDRGAVDRLLARCLAVRARVQQTRSQFAEGEATAAEALALAQQAGDLEAEWLALAALGALTLHQRRYAEAERLLERLRDLGRRRRLPIAEAQALNDLAANEIYQGNYKRAIDVLQQAQRLAEDHDLSAHRRRALTNQAICHIYLGELDRAQAILEGWIKPPGEAVNLEDAGDYDIYVNLLLMRGDYERAIAYGQQAIAILRRAKDRQGEIFALLNIADPLASLGRLWESRQVVDRALTLNDEIGDASMAAAALNALGYIMARLGDAEGGERHLQQGLPLAIEAGEQISVIQIYNNLAIARVNQGDVDGAVEAARHAVQQARAAENHKQLLHALVTLAQMLYAAGNREKAAELCGEAIAGWQVGSDQAYWVEPQALLSAIRLDQGRSDEAKRLIEPVLVTIGDRFFFEAEQPELLFCRCYDVLGRLADERAAPLLDRAIAQIDHVSSTIPSPLDRRRYRQALPASRRLLALRA